MSSTIKEEKETVRYESIGTQTEKIQKDSNYDNDSSFELRYSKISEISSDQSDEDLAEKFDLLKINQPQQIYGRF